MLQNIFRNMPPVVKNLLIINLLVFLLSFVLENQGINIIREFGIYYPGSQFFKPYQLVTSMFTHANLPHIFFNMFALIMFGGTLEKAWGPKRFLLFYFITGIGATLCHIGVQAIEFHNVTGQFSFDFLINPDGSIPGINDTIRAQLSTLSSDDGRTISSILFTPAVGASGAIFGVLIGFAMLFPNTELMMMFIPIPIKAKYFIGFYIVLELYLGLNNFDFDSVAHFAHLGGALFGFIMVKIWQKDKSQMY